MSDERKTATETLRDRATFAYRHQVRFRGMVDHIVNQALNEHEWYLCDPKRSRRDLAEYAQDVAAQVLKLIYEEDAEIARLTQERDHYKKLAEEALAVRPMPMFIKPTTGAESER